ncbi:MAG: lipid-A-disaccharide synthase [Candidatus Muiribacteriota bacterium]
MKRIFFSTGEISGDLHAGHIIRVIKKNFPDVVIDGIGGKKMAENNVNLLENIIKLGDMGFFEILKNIFKYKNLLQKVKEYLIENKPDKVILVDFAGMNFRIGRIAKDLGIEVIYYIPPKVWAWKKNRLKEMKKICDKVICLFDFEKEIFEKHGFDKVYYFGNPLVEFVKPQKNQTDFLAGHSDINKEDKIILLMPGSRNQEINKNLPEILKTASILHKKDKSLKFVLLKPVDVYIDININKLEFPLIIKDKDLYSFFKFAFFGIVSSGTATLEAAISNLPIAVVYKVNFLTYHLARMIINIDYVSLPNIIAGYQVVPEFIQNDFKAPLLADYILENIQSEEKYLKIKKELSKTVDKLYREKITDNIAEEIMR